MSVATDRVSRPHLWLAAIGLGLGLSLLGTGCARMQPFRKPSHEPADLGAVDSPPPTPLTSTTPPRARDGYAEWLEARTPSPSPHASGTRVRSTLPSPAHVAAVPGPSSVALQPPTPLRNGNSPGAPESEILAEQPADSGAIALADPLPPVEPESRGSMENSASLPAEVPVRELAPVQSPPADDLAQFRQVVAMARQRIDGISSYQLQMNRQERVGAELQPVEDVLVSIRRNPLAVRLEWPQGPNQGREVLYQTGGSMHIKMPNALVPRLSLPPDSPLALRNSRHPIQEAGFETIVTQLEQTLALHATPAGSQDDLSYGGLEAPVPQAPSCHKLVRKTPSGETWLVYIDAGTRLPFLVQGTDGQGQLLERYVFRDVKVDLPELATTAAFDPDQRFGAPRGLFDRLARSAGAAASGTPDPATVR